MGSHPKWRILAAAIVLLALASHVRSDPLPCTAPTPTSKASDMCDWSVPGSTYHLHYYRSQDLTVTDTSIRRAFIAVHGRRSKDILIDDRPQDYYEHMVNAATDRGVLGETLIIAPHFCRSRKKDYSNNTWKDNPVCGGESSSDGRLCWGGSDPEDWPNGGNAANDSGNIDTSTFSLMDDIINELATSGKFPNLNEIVVTGQSGGGQFVQRYAMASDLNVPWINIRYIACNPGGMTYLSGSRPTEDSIRAFPNIIGNGNASNTPPGVSGSLSDLEEWSTMPYAFNIPYDFTWQGTDCYSDGSYDAWPWGLADVSNNDYMATFVVNGWVARSRYLDRRVVILFGIDDNDYFSPPDGSEWNCPHATQGQTRVERGVLFFDHMCENWDCSAHGLATVDADTNGDGVMDGIKHGGEGMYMSEATRSILVDDAKPPGIAYQKTVRALSGSWTRLSLSHLAHSYPAGSFLIVEPGSDYDLFLQYIRPHAGYQGRLSVPVRVRSPITDNAADGTFISNQFFLKVDVGTNMEFLFPHVLGKMLMDDE